MEKLHFIVSMVYEKKEAGKYYLLMLSERHLDQDRMLLKPFPITGFIGLEKMFTFLMYFFITDSCMITTKSWKRPCEFTCIQAQETYFSKTPLHTYK